MNINNPTLFFIGIILLLLGAFIIIFDYPQIQYFDSLEPEFYTTLNLEQKEIYDRLKIEFSIGAVIFLGGLVFCIFSIFNIYIFKR